MASRTSTENEEAPGRSEDADPRNAGTSDFQSGNTGIGNDQNSSSSDPDESWTYIYSTKSAIVHPIKLLTDIVTSTYAGRELAYRFFQRNIRGAYRQTLLGFIWILLPVLIQIGAWYFLYKQGLVDAKGVKDYLMFLAIGTVLWQTFFDSILAPLDAMNSNSSTMTKLNFPRETLVLVGIWTVMFNLIVRVVLIGGLCAFYYSREGGIVMSVQTWLVPVFLMALIFLGTGIGLLISPFGILYQDVGRSLGIISPFWMMTTPVLSFAASYNSTWNALNPPAGLLAASRDLIMYGQSDMTWLATIWLVIAIPYFLIGLIWYRISFPIVIERMSN